MLAKLFGVKATFFLYHISLFKTCWMGFLKSFRSLFEQTLGVNQSKV